MEPDLQKYEAIHFDAGYKLATTASVFVPWFQCTLKCRCEQERPMSELDKFFCMCIDRGINTPKDISFVLSLDIEITKGEIDRLVSGGILLAEKDKLVFTSFGTECFLHKTKVQKEIKEFPIAVNAITGEWAVDENGFFSEKVDNTAISLSPIKTVVKDDIENNDDIRRGLEEANETNIIQLTLMDYKTIAYRQESILFYQNENDSVLFEIYDGKKEELDLALASSLRKKYEKREILELMQAEKHLKIARLALLDHLREEHPKANLIPAKSNLKYVRNQEIRELFLKELDEVKEHIFIISPWITDFVVDEKMVERFERTLKRGVKIDIGFGYVSLDKMNGKIKKYKKDVNKEKIMVRKKSDKEYQSLQMAFMLRDRFKKYENFHIFYVREGTHEKVFCYDDTYILIGSLNLLSYDGGEQENYSGLKFRYEGGVLIEDKVFALEVMKDFEASIADL